MNKSEPAESTHLLFVDFDGVLYQLTSLPDSKSVLILSMSLKCFPELLQYGVESVLQREYGPLLLNTPEQGYDVSLRIDLDQLPFEKGI